MTIEFSASLDAFEYPSGPPRDNALKVATGSLTLVAGTASEVLPVGAAIGIPQATRRTPGGAIGDLTATYTAATRTVTITSANAGDTSIVSYMIIGI